jgi:hypothetical protein
MKSNKATERFCYFSAKKGSGKRWGVSILILAFSCLNPLLVFSAALLKLLPQSRKRLRASESRPQG